MLDEHSQLIEQVIQLILSPQTHLNDAMVNCEHIAKEIGC